MKQVNRRNLVVLLLYSLLTVVLTYPLVLQMGSHVPGTAIWSMDEYGYVWNNWWFKTALLDRGTNPFHTNFLFYPLGTSLVLYAYTLLHVMLALPLQLAAGLIPAVNTTVLFSFVAAAFGMYLFSSYLLRVSLKTWSEKYGEKLGPVLENDLILSIAAFIAGLVFAFTSNRFVYLSLGHYNIVASEWLPFYLLFFFKTLLEPRWKNALLAGLFAALALYTETTDGVLIALLSGIILIFEWRLLSRAALLRIGAMVAAAAVFFAPLLLPTLSEILFSGYSMPGWGHSEKLLVDLNGFFSPTSLHPLNRFWETELDRVRQGISRFSDINTFFVGYATAILALTGFVRFARRNRLWLAVALVFSILALGPLLHINGQSEFDLDGLATTVPLPFLILHYIPLIKENRVPNRYSILVTIALAILIAYAAWFIVSRIYSWLSARHGSDRLARVAAILAGGLLSLVLVFEHLALPLPLTDATVPDVYKEIGKDPGDFTVLSLPLGWRDSFGQLGAEDTRTQYYQAATGKYLLTGQIQRNPPSTFQYFQDAPIIRSLIAIESYKPVAPETIEADKRVAGQFVYFFDIRYIVINRAVPGRPPYSDTRASTVEYLQNVLPLGDKIYDQDGTVAYRVIQPAPSDQVKVNLGDESARLFLADGWTDPGDVGGATAAWTNQQSARLFVPLRGAPADYKLTIRSLPFEYPSHTQTLALKVNGMPAGALTLKPGWNEYALPIPASLIKSGLNELTWSAGYLVRPSDVIAPDYTIGKTGVKSPIDIAVQSTSEFGSIKVAGKEVSPLKRGYNLVAIDPNTGSVLSAANFDTGGTSIVESRSLTDYIKRLPQGVIVAGAVQEEAAPMLRDGSAGAIKSLGLTTDLRGTEGNTHAFIAVKGKSGGLEATGEGPSSVSVGHSTDTRLLGAALDWVEIDPAGNR